MVRLQQILDDPTLELRHVGGPQDFGRELTGAHSSEQLDPTPHLRGGELLMLDGLVLPPGIEAARSYMHRLSDRGIAAVAFGVADQPPFRQEVPPELVGAAAEFDLPLFEIPFTTPFLAVTQAVFRKIAEERFAETELLAEGQQRLAAAAARPTPLDQIVVTLSETAGLSSTVFDPNGQSLTVLTDRKHAELVARRLDQLRDRQLRVAISEETTHLTLELQPLGIEGLRGAAVYALPKPAQATTLTRGLAAFATSLLSIELERRHAIRVLERRPADQAIRRLLTAMPPARALQLVTSVGIRSERVQAVSVPNVRSGNSLVDDIEAAAPAILLCHYRNDELILLIPAHATITLDGLSATLNTRPAGLGGAVPPHNFAVSLRQARQAVEVSERSGGGLVDAMELGSIRVLLQLGSPDSLRAFADAVLGPLEATDRAGEASSLLNSLRRFLEADGVHEQAALAAGVHRHTLRKHLRRIEALTQRSLDSTADRTELWMALQARDLASST